jgi:hypothetical protein
MPSPSIILPQHYFTNSRRWAATGMTASPLACEVAIGMAHFPDPRSALVFKRIFGEPPEIPRGFLNEVLPFADESQPAATLARGWSIRRLTGHKSVNGNILPVVTTATTALNVTAGGTGAEILNTGVLVAANHFGGVSDGMSAPAAVTLANGLTFDTSLTHMTSGWTPVHSTYKGKWEPLISLIELILNTLCRRGRSPKW